MKKREMLLASLPSSVITVVTENVDGSKVSTQEDGRVHPKNDQRRRIPCWWNTWGDAGYDEAARGGETGHRNTINILIIVVVS